MENLTAKVDFTDSAVAKVNSLIEEDESPDLCLRVYITGGGCSGFQYGFMFDEEIKPDDYVLAKQVAAEEEDGGESGGSSSVRLLIDAMSYQYLKGATIDYREDINGAQFVIKNPNAKTTCGCGSSFGI